jgi:hypothetical protein
MSWFSYPPKEIDLESLPAKKSRDCGLSRPRMTYNGDRFSWRNAVKVLRSLARRAKFTYVKEISSNKGISP